MVEASKNRAFRSDGSVKKFYFHHSIFPRRDRSSKYRFVYVIFSAKIWPTFTLYIPPTLEFFADFHWDLSRNWINIYDLYYNVAVVKKESVKLLLITILGPYLGKNWESIDHAQCQVQYFFLELTQGDHKLWRTFYFIKISQFWLSYEWFFVLCDVLLSERAISSWNRRGNLRFIW